MARVLNLRMRVHWEGCTHGYAVRGDPVPWIVPNLSSILLSWIGQLTVFWHGNMCDLEGSEGASCEGGDVQEECRVFERAFLRGQNIVIVMLMNK